MPDQEVIAMYEGCHVPLDIMSDFYGKVMDCTGARTIHFTNLITLEYDWFCLFRVPRATP